MAALQRHQTPELQQTLVSSGEIIVYLHSFTCMPFVIRWFSACVVDFYSRSLCSVDCLDHFFCALSKSRESSLLKVGDGIERTPFSFPPQDSRVQKCSLR